MIIDSFMKDILGPLETFIDFIQWLSLAVSRIISNSETRRLLIESVILKMLMPKAKGQLGI